LRQTQKHSEYKQVETTVHSVKRSDQMTDEELRKFIGNDKL